MGGRAKGSVALLARQTKERQNTENKNRTEKGSVLLLLGQTNDREIKE